MYSKFVGKKNAIYSKFVGANSKYVGKSYQKALYI